MTSIKKRISATLTAVALTIGLTIPAMAVETPDKPIRISSYKGSTLSVADSSSVPAVQTTPLLPAIRIQWR